MVRQRVFFEVIVLCIFCIDAQVFSYVSCLIFSNMGIKSYFPFCIFIIYGVYAICSPLLLLLSYSLIDNFHFRFSILKYIS